MAYKPVEKPIDDVRERMFLPELLRGLAITTRHFLRNLFGDRDKNPDVISRQGTSLVSTVQYPQERVNYPQGYRGLHRLVPREDGKPRCVACYMCATVCPAQCIYIEAGEYERSDPSDESKVIEKFPTAFVIDELRCVVCGLCVDACPKDAIRMDRFTYDPKMGHTPSEYSRQGFVYDIPKLLDGPPVSHPSDPWNKRDSSNQPHHVHKEAHTRIGEGLVQLKTPDRGALPPPTSLADAARKLGKVEVDHKHPVPVTRFHK